MESDVWMVLISAVGAVVSMALVFISTEGAGSAMVAMSFFHLGFWWKEYQNRLDRGRPYTDATFSSAPYKGDENSGRKEGIMKWKVKTARVGSPELDNLLDEGWEPVGVASMSRASEYLAPAMHWALRRPRSVPRGTHPKTAKSLLRAFEALKEHQDDVKPSWARWVQCTQCGYGTGTTRAEQEDLQQDGTACPHCGVGILTVSPGEEE